MLSSMLFAVCYTDMATCQSFCFATFNVSATQAVVKWKYLEEQLNQFTIDIIVVSETTDLPFQSNKYVYVNHKLPQETRGVGLIYRGDIPLQHITLHPSGRIIYCLLNQLLIVGLYATQNSAQT